MDPWMNFLKEFAKALWGIVTIASVFILVRFSTQKFLPKQLLFCKKRWFIISVLVWWFLSLLFIAELEIF